MDRKPCCSLSRTRSCEKSGSVAAVCLAAALGGMTAPAAAQTAFLDLNATGQYTANFNPFANGGTSFSFAASAAGGVNGTGCVSVNQSIDTTATYNARSWNFSTNGATATLSVMIKANALANSGDKIQLGFINVTNNGLNNNAGIAFESFFGIDCVKL